VTDHLSIGEVLSLLQEEFPDVTISKIRFLESQGLIDPERTPSGYRKFYEADIDRLRWILVQQREHFLPLKVIKDRLGDPDGGQGALPLGGTSEPPPPMPGPVATSDGAAEPEVTPEHPDQPDDDDEPAPAAAGDPAPPVDAVLDLAGADGDGSAPPPIWMVDLAKASAQSKAEAAANEAERPLTMDTGPSEISLTADELCLAAGITKAAMADLERYGLLAGRSLGDATYYDGDALVVASKASGFLARGVEARHLRMYKVSAEREAGFLEQLAMPMLKQRNPQARRDAVAMVEELSSLGHDLRAALLRANLRRHLDQG
jgi:DNA-binding transcriptional MerR regulator